MRSFIITKYYEEQTKVEIGGMQAGVKELHTKLQLKKTQVWCCGWHSFVSG
jgi:hypothetical protein